MRAGYDFLIFKFVVGYRLTPPLRQVDVLSTTPTGAIDEPRDALGAALAAAAEGSLRSEGIFKTTIPFASVKASAIALPLRSSNPGDIPLGALVAWDPPPPVGFSAEDESILPLLAQGAQIALTNCNRFKRAALVERRLKALISCTPPIISARESRALFAAVARTLRALVDADAVALFLAEGWMGGHGETGRLREEFEDAEGGGANCKEFPGRGLNLNSGLLVRSRRPQRRRGLFFCAWGRRMGGVRRTQ